MRLERRVYLHNGGISSWALRNDQDIYKAANISTLKRIINQAMKFAYVMICQKVLLNCVTTHIIQNT